MPSCVRCGGPFTGTPWRYGPSGREHVDCKALNPYDIPPPPVMRVFTPAPAPAPKKAGSRGGPRQCAAVKPDGTRCRGGAKKGYDLCGPHLDKKARRM